jgi:hypothetical protein
MTSLYRDPTGAMGYPSMMKPGALPGYQPPINKIATQADGNPHRRIPGQDPFSPSPPSQPHTPPPVIPPPSGPAPGVSTNPFGRGDPTIPPTGPGFPGPGTTPGPGGVPRRDPSEWRSRTGGYTQPTNSAGWEGIPGWGEQGEGEGRTFGRAGLDPRLDAMYDWALRESQARYQDPEGRTFYGGPTVAGFDPRELLAQQMLQQAGGEQRGMGQDSAGYIRTMMDRAVNPMDDPTLDSAIDLTLKDVRQQATDPGGVFSQIRGNAMESGAYGGTRQGVLEGVAGGRLADVMAKTAANMRLEGRSQNLTAARDAMGQMPTAAGLLGAEAGAYGATGAQSRDMEQRFMDDDLRRWSYDVTEPDRRLDSLFRRTGQADLGKWQSGSQYMSPLGMDALEEGISQGPSGAQSALGWLSALGGLWNQFGR